MDTKPESLGDRMKKYEENARSYVDHTTPLVMRLDGHCFSKFTRGLKKPYEEWLHRIMVKVTSRLVEEYNAACGYTQSDEITLVFVPQVLEGKPQPYIFANQVQKLVSLAASNATNIFTFELLSLVMSGKIKADDYKENVYKKLAASRAYFDARVFNVPDLTECYNNLFWRSTHDCVRNSVSMTAQCHFNQKTLQGLSRKQQLEKLTEKGIDWEAMDPEFKYGTFVKKKIVTKTLDAQAGKKVEQEKEVEGDKEVADEDNDEVEVKTNTVERRKLYAFSMHLQKYDEKVEDFLFSKYYQDENEEVKKLVCKEYLVE